MSPDRRFLPTTAFRHHGPGKIACFVLSQVEATTGKASRAARETLVIPPLTIA